MHIFTLSHVNKFIEIIEVTSFLKMSMIVS